MAEEEGRYDIASESAILFFNEYQKMKEILDIISIPIVMAEVEALLQSRYKNMSFIEENNNHFIVRRAYDKPRESPQRG